jgi:hypothetical protein
MYKSEDIKFQIHIFDSNMVRVLAARARHIPFSQTSFEFHLGNDGEVVVGMAVARSAGRRVV